MHFQIFCDFVTEENRQIGYAANIKNNGGILYEICM